jgi:hypothetical protein
LNRPALFSDSALKVVFTTLYVDIKEPAFPRIQATKKLNLAPTKISACRDVALAKAGSEIMPGQN